MFSDIGEPKGGDAAIHPRQPSTVQCYLYTASAACCIPPMCLLYTDNSSRNTVHTLILSQSVLVGLHPSYWRKTSYTFNHKEPNIEMRRDLDNQQSRGSISREYGEKSIIMNQMKNESI